MKEIKKRGLKPFKNFYFSDPNDHKDEVMEHKNMQNIATLKIWFSEWN